MGSDGDDPSSLSLDDVPAKPSFFSRLASPLRSRARNLADFHIKLKEPHRQYSAGDHVKGHVVLKVVKPFRMTHLTVALHGYVRAFKNASAAAQLGPVNPSVASGDRHKSYRYHGNGHASLFHDEQVLCGEGRLKPSRFEFEFDLLFPDGGLPSSIEFERGTISYVITATLTRPTTISPTSTCETKVSLVEKVDIGVVTPPRERTVTMQTMRRRPRRRKTGSSKPPSLAKQAAPTESADTASDIDSTRANEMPSQTSAASDDAAPGGAGTATSTPRNLQLSEVQSEFSGESAVSNNSGSNSGRIAEASIDTGRLSNSDDREIKAAVELLKGGCLPGDVLPIRIRVDHNRRMKSMNGIIVTLYRQGRVDYAPPAHMFTNLTKEEAARLEEEQYYPKSKTGLGGLSLSAAGSCSVFRKDLSQAVAPLIINPATLTAHVNTLVRVPEDVFPTIKGVPGGLVSFKYHVEVVIDLGGRLGGSSASSQQPGRMASLNLHGGGGSSPNPYDTKNLTNWTGTIVDTDQLRREKGVIAVSFEVIVGTTDSSRTRAPATVPAQINVQPPSSYGIHEEPEPGDYEAGWLEENLHEGDLSSHYDPHQPQEASQGYFPNDPGHQQTYYNPHDDYPAEAPAYVAPPPQISAGENLSDKARMRQAEELLLPSRPPQNMGESAAGPSHAIEAREDGNILGDETSQAGGSGLQRQVEDSAVEEPSAPTATDLAQGPASAPTEDKQEIERRRLMDEASVPPEVPEDYEAAGPSAPPAMGLEPTAPSLDDDDYDRNDHYTSHDPFHGIAGPSAPTGSEPLPRYER